MEEDITDKLDSETSGGVTGYRKPNEYEVGILYAVCRVAEMSAYTEAEDIIIQSGVSKLDLTDFDTIDKDQIKKLGDYVTTLFTGL